MTSSPRSQCAITAARLDCVPDGKKSPACMPKRSAQTSWSLLTVGSSPNTSSPTAASAMALRMPGEGWVTVSLRKSTGLMHAFYNPASLTGRLHLNRSILALAALLACSSVHADYDAKMEAQEKAKF